MTQLRFLLLFAFALLSLMGSQAWADNFRPAYLQLTERSGDAYDVRWKTPAQSEVVVMPIRPVFPPASQMTKPLVSSYASGSAVMIGQVKVSGGLSGKTIRFEGLAGTGNQVLVRMIRADASEELYKVLPTDPQLTIPRVPDPVSISARYTVLGIEHILLGFDHLCFVLALVLIVRGTRRLIWTVTAFTIAHSITLALATLGAIHVPGPPVEATIALSIIFVANEIIQQRRGREGLASKRPWLVAFAFGLLHGFGFAGALAEVGLPPNAIPLALLFFNVGVEIGQLLFIAAVLLAIRLLSRLTERKAELRNATVVSAYAIGGLASYWLIERVSGFWD